MVVKEEKVARANEPAVLPEGWRRVKFGDVVRDVKITVDPEMSGLERYVAGEHMGTDDLHIRSWGTVGDGYLGPAFHRKFIKGQILYGSRRTYLRKVAVAGFDGICANTTFVLEPTGDELLPELLPFVMQTESFNTHAVKQSRGSVNPYVNWKDIAWYEFALPPIDEQHRIAEILWATDESCECYINVIKSIEDLESTILTRLTCADDSNEIRLRELAEVSYGLTINASRREMSLEMPYLRVGNVMRGWLKLEEIKTIGCTSEDITRFALRDKDVLVVEGHASVDEIGRSALWRSEIDECLHQNHILRVRCGAELIPDYLVAYINSSSGKSYCKRHAKSTSGLHTINSTVLKEMKLPLPSVAKQRSVVNTLQIMRQKREQLSSHLSLLIELKNILLKKLLGHSMN